MSCRGTTRAGQPCRFTVALDADYCFNHDPAVDRSAIARRAAATRNRPAYSSSFLTGTALTLNDRPSIQAFIDAIIRLSLAGRLSDRKTHLALRAAEAAARNFDRASEYGMADRPRQQHDWDTYFARLKAFLATVDPLLVDDMGPIPVELHSTGTRHHFAQP